MTTQSPAVRLGIAAVFKNEAPYLLEWIAHHRLQGVTDFFIADNQSTDGTSQLLQALAEAGLVHYLPFPTPPGCKPQLPAYRKLLALYGSRVDWMAIIDADEFIWPASPGDTLARWLFDHPPVDDVGALVLNWAVYGSSGALRVHPGLVTERMTARAHPEFPPNHHFKSLVRPAAVADVINPHCVMLKGTDRCTHLDGSPCLQTRAGLSEVTHWTPFRINHYVIKSWSEYMLRKRPRGTADGPDDGYPAAFFHEHDRNDVTDVPPRPQTERLLEEIGFLKETLTRQGFAGPGFEEPEAPDTAMPSGLLQGSLESVQCEEQGLQLSGWALSRQVKPLSRFALELGATSLETTLVRRVPRLDVCSHFPRSTGESGFVVEVPWAQLTGCNWEEPVLIGHDEAGVCERLPEGTPVNWSEVRTVAERGCQISGHIDRIEFVAEGFLEVQGWGLEWKRSALHGVELRQGDVVVSADSFWVMARSDVAAAFPGAELRCGFTARFALPKPELMIEVLGINAQGRRGRLASVQVPGNGRARRG